MQRARAAAEALELEAGTEAHFLEHPDVVVGHASLAARVLLLPWLKFSKAETYDDCVGSEERQLALISSRQTPERASAGIAKHASRLHGA